jgi:hypothetical protein
MPTFWIVEHLDVVENILLGFGACCAVFRRMR